MCIQCVIPCIPYWVEFHLLLVASWSTTETGFEILFVCHVMFVVNALNIGSDMAQMDWRKHKKKGEEPKPLPHLIALTGLTSSPLPFD